MALRRRAYMRIDAITGAENPQERSACSRMFNDTGPSGWIALVLRALDAAGALSTSTDTEIDTAVTAVWNRIKVSS